MDKQLLLLDLLLKRVLEQMAQRTPSKEELYQFTEIAENAERELKRIFTSGGEEEAVLDECDLVQSQVALLKKLLAEAAKEQGDFCDALGMEEDEDVDDGEDETLRMILKLQERRKSEKKQVLEDEQPILSRRKIQIQSSPKEQEEEKKQDNEQNDKMIDDLTDLMVGHASQLKEHSKAFRDLLKEDVQAMDEAEQSLNSVSDRFQRESGNLRGVTKRSWRDSWTAIAYFCLTVLVFFFMYIFIRLT